MYMSKTSINSKIQKFGRGPLRICPLDGQIQGEGCCGYNKHSIEKCHTFPLLKHLKGSLPLYFPYLFLSFLTKWDSFTSNSLSDLLLDSCSPFFIFFEALKVASLLMDFLSLS
jgi:hypothetical protein